MKRFNLSAVLGLGIAAATLSALPVRADQLPSPPSYGGQTNAQLATQLGGPKYTCMGAERAGNKAGTIPAWSGKWEGAPPGLDIKNDHGLDPNPYAKEKPLFIITAKNMDKYKAHLTAGQIALFKLYPKAFWMPVYPSHRDFRYPEHVCKVVKMNLLHAKLKHHGLATSHYNGAIAFPFPRNGLQAVWNFLTVYRAHTEQAVQDQATVYPDGSISWGKVLYRILSLTNAPSQTGKPVGKVDSYFNITDLLPERNRGTISTGWQPTNFYNYVSTQAWQYLPGLRRVRQAPQFAFDAPAVSSGFRTVADDRLFNGSPVRFKWKLLGKKEIYVPYDDYKIMETKDYKKFLTPYTVNPKYMRYELHRVWVVEADIKPGYRDLYHKQMFYADEDTWLPLWADNYDSHMDLWRPSMQTYFYDFEAKLFQAGVSVYHDLTAKAYIADRLVADSPKGWQINTVKMTPDQFSPAAAKRNSGY